MSRSAAAACTAWLLACAPQASVEHALEGRWQAEARLGPEAMALVLDVAPRGAELTARISVPAEHVLGLGVESFQHAGAKVSFRIPHPDHPMDFTGALVGEKLDGTLAMGGRELPLAFRRSGPVPAPPYREIEVSFPGAGRSVQGSLLLPTGAAPRAALVMFHSTTGGRRDDVRFCADLAARQGLAALIYDRRSVAIDVARLTREDFLAVVADAEAAVRFLRAREGIDAARVGVGGLSQGAWISAIVATRVPEVAFVLALSPPGVPLHEIDMYQSARRLREAGASDAEIARASELLRESFAASRGRAFDGATLLRWSAHDLDPASFFARVKVPVFLAFGERDERLPAEACAARLADVLAKAGNTAVRLERYPGANHALLPAPELEAQLIEWLRSR